MYKSHTITTEHHLQLFDHHLAGGTCSGSPGDASLSAAHAAAIASAAFRVSPSSPSRFGWI
jgi:hypothetical protein